MAPAGYRAGAIFLRFTRTWRKLLQKKHTDAIISDHDIFSEAFWQQEANLWREVASNNLQSPLTWEERSRKARSDAWLHLGERGMEAGKGSATPMAMQPYRGFDQQPMSTTPSKLLKKAERCVAAPLRTRPHHNVLDQSEEPGAPGAGPVR
jgi:hypothetical protein